ncbi:hypothetical protein E4U09_003396 [Claviceps aff. purpurea]|uniref:Uncharacterized protein n=1 Tax=Claviceps aff. purpurea TaxID=1967640 RepID=A0A9P7U239_9HYPO|nr:hypothetical protein E4U09_003396 [Claviceps aff. purpurea]
MSIVVKDKYKGKAGTEEEPLSSQPINGLVLAHYSPSRKFALLTLSYGNRGPMIYRLQSRQMDDPGE